MVGQEDSFNDASDSLAAAKNLNDCAPFGFGDASYPLGECFVEPLSASSELRSQSDAWRELTGHLVGATEALDEVPPDPPSCNDMFGFGRCQSKISEDQQERFKHCMQQCDELGRLARASDSLQVFLCTFGDARLVLLSTFVLLSDPTTNLFYKLRTQGDVIPEPGTLISIPFGGPDAYDSLTYLPDVELAFTVSSGVAPMLVKKVLYQPIVGEQTDVGKLPLCLRVTQAPYQTKHVAD